MSHPKVLVVSQASEVKRAVVAALCDCGLLTVIATSVEEARTIAKRHPLSLILCSDELSGAMVEDFVRQVTLPPLRIPVVVVLRVGEWDRCLHFLNVGAHDCLAYPLSPSEIKRITQSVPGLMIPPKPYETPLRQRASAA